MTGATKEEVVVILGAAGGLGVGLATCFAARGSSVVMSDFEEASLLSASDEIRATGADVVAHRCDIADPAQVVELREVALERFGRIDIVFNTVAVGVGVGEPVWMVPQHDWDWVMAVNFGGVVNVIRSFVPYLVSRGIGHVLNTASTTAVAPALANLAVYTTSKHAVVGVSESLQQDLRTRGSDVRVSVVFPGAVRSRMASAQRNRQARFGPPREDEAHSAELQRYLDAQPLGESVATRILTQMDEGRFYIFGRDDELRLADDRAAGIRDGYLPTPPALGPKSEPSTGPASPSHAG